MTETFGEINNPADWDDLRSRIIKAIRARIDAGKYAPEGTSTRVALPKAPGILGIRDALEKSELDECIRAVRTADSSDLHHWAKAFDVPDK